MKQQRLFSMAFLLAFPILMAFTPLDDQSSRSKSFTVTKGGLVEVSVDGGDIRVSSWEKNEVFVRAEGIDEDNLDRLKMDQSGNTVRIEYRNRRGWNSGHTRFEISVPTQFNTDLRTSGGDIEIRGDIDGRIKGSTSGGDVILGNLSKGTVDLSTSGGDMRTGDIQGDVNLRTSGGNIELGKVGGNADVKTSGGDIRVESVGKTLKASTSGGDISIGDVGGEATVSTSGGDVKVRRVAGWASLSTSGGNIELLGASGKVKANTSGGDIRLEDITGSIEAATAGGDVSAELKPTGTGRSRLSSAGGEITLYVPENAKATIEAIIEIEGRWGRRNKEYEIKSDFKEDQYDKSGRDDDDREIRAVYKLNGGGEDIMLKTVNSNIYIKKLRR
ncbi:MAG: DUF4097 family beta strand repeat protein [Ignavibacteriales bacterium]|nr:DUF4097 family beta strand repeat protein [Ignavibacteriales bacterium]